LIGVINKCLTIFLNLLIWDQHAPVGGIASLFVCLVGGTLYRQAPMRSVGASKDADEGNAADSGDDTVNKDEELGNEIVPLVDKNGQSK